MRWPWTRATRTTDTPFVVRERQAYAAVEEARLWCEELLKRSATDDARRFARALHREIGMAGLHAGHHLRPERRRAMLALAYERIDDRVVDAHEAQTLESLREFIDRALEQVRGALGVEGLCDEMEEAHLRLLTARELLLAVRIEPRHLTAQS